MTFAAESYFTIYITQRALFWKLILVSLGAFELMQTAVHWQRFNISELFIDNSFIRKTVLNRANRKTSIYK